MSLYNVPATSQILIKTLGCVLNLYELLPLPDSAPNPAITTYLHIAQGRATLVMTLFTIGSSIIIILMVLLNIVKVFVAVLTFLSKFVPSYQSRLIKSAFCHHITKNLIDCFSEE